MIDVKFRAMRAAGIACFVTLVIIGIWVFSTPSNVIGDTLEIAGQLVGGGETYGAFMLAALPPVVGFIIYHVWKWVIK